MKNIMKIEIEGEVHEVYITSNTLFEDIQKAIKEIEEIRKNNPIVSALLDPLITIPEKEVTKDNEKALVDIARYHESDNVKRIWFTINPETEYARTYTITLIPIGERETYVIVTLFSKELDGKDSYKVIRVDSNIALLVAKAIFFECVYEGW